MSVLPAVNYSVALNAPLSLANAATPGLCVLPNSAGLFVAATAANYAALPSAPLVVISNTSSSGMAEAVCIGLIPPTIFNLGAGAASPVVADPTTGVATRGTSAGLVVGSCDAQGTVTVFPAALLSVIVGVLAGDATGLANANRVEQLSGNSGTSLVTLPSTKTIKQTQGGTLVAPTTEYPLRAQARDPAAGAFEISLSGTSFSGVMDYVGEWGYNLSNSVPTVPIIRSSIEADFINAGVHTIECHPCQFTLPPGWGGGAGYTHRVWTMNAFATGQVNVGSQVRGGGQSYVSESDTGRQLWVADNANGFRVTTSGVYAGKLQNDNAGLLASWGFADNTSAVNGAVGYWQALTAMQLSSVTGIPIWLGRMDATGANRRVQVGIDTTNGVQLFSLGSSPTFDLGGGVGVLGITDANTVPAGLPTTGGILYSRTGGQLEWKTPSAIAFRLGLASSDYLALGSGAATVGRIRMSNADSIIWRASYAADIPVLQYDATDNIILGAGSGTAATKIRGTTFVTVEVGGTAYANISPNGVQFFNTTTMDLGGGVGVIGIHNATTVPTTNPTNGSITYTEGGKLKTRSSDGTVTVLGYGT